MFASPAREIKGFQFCCCRYHESAFRNSIVVEHFKAIAADLTLILKQLFKIEQITVAFHNYLHVRVDSLSFYKGLYVCVYVCVLV